MISIVVVYNNKRTLNNTLLKSLKRQTAEYELIALDNTKRKFKSASEALNWGGKQTNGEYIMFIHQDVELDSDSWLERVEKILNEIPDLGIAGIAGMSEKGETDKERGRGYARCANGIWELANQVQKPEEVQTLDASLLIIPKSVFNKMQFDDETFDGWHCYGDDYCLCVRRMGLKTYVVPMFIYHWSLGQDIKSLFKYQKKLYNKHAKSHKKIFTTCGEISWHIMLRSPIEFLRSLNNRLFLNQIDYLKKELSDCDSILDLGCGGNSPIRWFFNIPSLGVEISETYLQQSLKKNIHDQYIKADIRKIEFKDSSFDAVLALNVMEYLTKQEGYELIQKMKRWARKKIILSTPNGYLYLNGHRDNPNKSEWVASEFEELNFKVCGMDGWKTIHCVGNSRFRLDILSRLFVNLTQRIVYNYPNFAFSLFCVKEIK